MIFFTSDTHFGHANIIKYCNRPFKLLEKMDETLIRNWNERVKPIDTVIFAGDFCFTNTKDSGEGTRKKYSWYKEQLNGDKIFLQGNHDRNNKVKSNVMSLVVRLHKKDIFVTHRPSDIVFGYDLYLVGHVHEKWKHKIINDGERKYILINVGVDVWNFKPVKIDEIFKYINRFI